jgi:predicted ATPase/class 3 adenylate cyclase
MTDLPATAIALPTGTVTFLFTDIEGSTRLLQELGDRYPALLAEHRRIIDGAVTEAGGSVFGTEGDAVFAAFGDAGSALRAAVAAQRALAKHQWPEERTVTVRMGIHTGEASLSGTDYVGLTLHQVARIAAAGHGGQVLVSDASRGLLTAAAHGLDVELRDLGEHRLKDLARAERLYQVTGADLGKDFGPLRTLDARPNNLPTQVTSFVGREEIETARGLLARTRLLTLTGPGGTGKTRLALQLSAELMEEYPDGVFFVPLDAVTDPELVGAAIAAAVSLDAGARPPIDALVDWGARRQVLLVLDNFEQVTDAAPQVGRLIKETTGVRIVVTSRIVLRVYGEQEFPVPPLRFPDPGAAMTAERAADFEAVRLFVERAVAASPSFRLTDEDAPAIVDIVSRLDGLPLAIELAAARVRVLPIASLRDRLDHRLAVLTGGARDLPARQQTLRGAIDWSYDLLTDPDKRLFERSSVFAGGACLTQAEAVCGPATELGGEVLDGLDALVQQSLLRSVPGGKGEPRFAMLPTIREYAAERAETRGDAGDIARRHTAAYLAMTESATGHFTGPEGRSWVDRIELDHDNLRAVLDRAVEQDDAETAMRLLVPMWRFWQIRGHLLEAENRVASILALPSAANQPPLLRAKAYGAAGGISYWRGTFATTKARYETALEEARRSGDRPAIAQALSDSGFGQVPDNRDWSHFREGMQRFLESLALFRELGDERGEAAVLWALSIADYGTNDLDAARTHVEEALVLYRKFDDLFGLGWAYHLRGLVDVRQSRLDDAERDFREALQTFIRSRDHSAMVIMAADFIMIANARGHNERKWLLAGALDTLRRETGSDLVNAPISSADLAPPTDPGDDPEAQRAWEAGTRMTLDEAIEYMRQPSPA